MKMTNKIGISLIGLCALLLLGSPIYAGIWTTMGGGCVPDEDSAGRIDLYEAIAHESGEVGTIVARCNIVDVEGDDVWQSLGITYQDPDGSGENYRVRVWLLSVSRASGNVSTIHSFDSNEATSSDRTFESYAFDHDFDFSESAYYLYVVLIRADDAESPEFLRAEISSREAPPENEPPQAAFSFETDGLTANFTDESTDSDGEVVAWSWVFGDGTESTEQNPSHPYDAADIYTVTLTVTDDQEAVSEPVEVEVEVTEDGCEVTFWPSDLNPGDQYHVVFITDDSDSDGTSDDIADYNAYVQDQAEWTTAMTENWCVQWFAIASTEAVDAKNNVPVDSAPVYLIGLQGTAIRVADDAADLWDGSIQATISTDQFNTRNTDSVWTGTAFDGTGFPDRVLGTTNPRAGYSGDTDGTWVSANSPASTDLYHLYAVSEVLTVPAE